MDEREFIDHIQSAYTPPEMSPNQAAAFDAALRDRLARPDRRWAFGLAGLALAGAAAALFWTLRPAPPAAPALPVEPPQIVVTPPPVESPLEDEAGELLALLDVDDESDLALPDDYEALADVLEL